jgi:mRNA-degrading endonuclease toxin of MazEF toxin-antitoxin module
MEIWWIDDAAVHLPQQPGKMRTLHPSRMVLVVSSQEDCVDAAVWTLQVVPLSTQVHWQRRNDVRLLKGEGGLNAQSVAQVGLLGPVSKEAFKDRVGVLPVSRFQAIQVGIRLSLGMKAR